MYPSGQHTLAIYTLYLAEGGHLITFTDHKPLISGMALHSSKCTEREIKQLDFLSHLYLKFRHVRGSDNVVADALS